MNAEGSVAADDDKVVLQHASHGLGTDGVTYDQRYCFVMTMRDDRIVEIVAHVDTDLLMRIIA
jgi:ketosteroid isomerase-like protein